MQRPGYFPIWRQYKAVYDLINKLAFAKSLSGLIFNYSLGRGLHGQIRISPGFARAAQLITFGIFSYPIHSPTEEFTG
jgi:hypothetical protein